jgi:hypothetical protein
MEPAPYPQRVYRPSPHPFGVEFQHLHSQQGLPTGQGSRQSSISNASYASSRSAASLTEEGTSPSTSSASDTDDNGYGRRARRGQNSSKNRKEKKHRADLGFAMQTRQFSLQCYADYVHGSEQSAGNAKSSGLNYNKLDIDNGHIAMSVRSFDYLFKKALENGTKDELQEWFRRCQTEYLEQEGDFKDPTYGTLMYDAGPRCFRDTNGACFTHGEQDINQCRRARARETFNRNVELYLQECEPGSRKRRLA